MTIYQDSSLTLVRQGSVLECRPVDGKPLTILGIGGLAITTQIPDDIVKSLRARNLDPANRYLLIRTNTVRPGSPAACLDNATRPAVEAAIEAVKSELEAAKRDPATVARRRVCDLFLKAERSTDNLDDFYLALRVAQDALEEWRHDYPAQAREEDRLQVRDQANHLRDLAAGALTYDADGSLSGKEMQRRHDEFIAQAIKLEQEAYKS